MPGFGRLRGQDPARASPRLSGTAGPAPPRTPGGDWMGTRAWGSAVGWGSPSTSLRPVPPPHTEVAQAGSQIKPPPPSVSQKGSPRRCGSEHVTSPPGIFLPTCGMGVTKPLWQAGWRGEEGVRAGPSLALQPQAGKPLNSPPPRPRLCHGWLVGHLPVSPFFCLCPHVPPILGVLAAPPHPPNGRLRFFGMSLQEAQHLPPALQTEALQG